GEVESHHHLVFRDGHIERLFYGLWLYSVPTQCADHLVGIPGIPAEPVPFGKQYQIGLYITLFIFRQQFLPFRPVERFYGMILKNDFANLYGINLTVFPQPFLLVTLGITFVRLFLGANPDG